MADQHKPSQVPESADQADRFSTRLPESHSPEPETVSPSGQQDAGEIPTVPPSPEAFSVKGDTGSNEPVVLSERLHMPGYEILQETAVA